MEVAGVLGKVAERSQYKVAVMSMVEVAKLHENRVEDELRKMRIARELRWR